MTPAIASVVLFFLMVLVLRWLGRRWWCACGSRNPWGGMALPHGSHHMFGPWSASHVLHGVVFCLVLHGLFGDALSASGLLLAVMVLEVGWEIVENTSHGIRATRVVIDRAYDGDSVANSVGDLLCCVAGAGLILLLV